MLITVTMILLIKIGNVDSHEVGSQNVTFVVKEFK